MSPLAAGIIFTSLNHAIFSGMRLAVALDAIRMQESPLMVGIITATFATLPMAGSLFMGRYIDRKGSGSLGLICVVLLASVAVLAALISHFLILALAGLVIGGAFMTTQIINQQVIGRFSTAENRIANFALAATGIAASATLSPMLTGFGIDHIGFSWTFMMLAVLPLISLQFIVFKKMPKLEPREQRTKSILSGSVVDLLRDEELRRIYLINVVFAASWDIFLFMTPLYGAALHLTASQIGIIISCFSSATFVVRLFAGPISRRYRSWQILLACMTLNGMSCLAFGLVSIVPMMMVFAFSMGLGHGLANPTMNSLLYENAPSNRISEVMGLRTSVSMSLQVGLPMVAGGLGALIGIAPLFWAVSIMQLASARTSQSRWHWKKPPKD